MLVLEGHEQAGHGLEVTDGAECLGRGPAEVPVALAQELHQGTDGRNGTNLAERLGCRKTQLLPRIRKKGKDAGNGLRLPHLPEGLQRRKTQARIGVVEQRHEHLGGIGLLLTAERQSGLLSHEAALVRERLAQQRADARRLHLPQGLQHGPPHPLSRIPRMPPTRAGNRGRIAHEAEDEGGSDPPLLVGAGESLHEHGHDPRRGHAGEGVGGALLDEVGLVAEQLEEQHGRVFVSETTDGCGRLGAHFHRRVVDEGRHEVGASLRGRSTRGTEGCPGARCRRGARVPGRRPRGPPIPMETRAWAAYSRSAGSPSISTSRAVARASRSHPRVMTAVRRISTSSLSRF